MIFSSIFNPVSGTFTVSLHSLVIPPTVAYINDVPDLCVVTSPFEFTVATSVFDDDHLTVASSNVASTGSNVTFNVSGTSLFIVTSV